jgi:oxygen-independent coproporphyrinogen-3 oxidase
MHGVRDKAPRITDALEEALQRRSAGDPVWRWFDRRVRGHMEVSAAMTSQPLRPSQGKAALGAALSRPAVRPRVLYVHVPFCTRICSFCAFFRKAAGSTDLGAYAAAVRRQIAQVAATPWANNGEPFRAVYFGGGTPTALPAEDLASLVHAIRRGFRLAEDCEVTVECRFDGVDQHYLQQLRHAGVNRLSFGVQSFDTPVRQAMGRIADREAVLGTLETAGDLGFANLSVDLIYNLPGQTPQSFAADLRDLAGTPATGASVYALIPMQGSALMKQIQLGTAAPLGTIEAEHAYYCQAHAALTKRDGWRRCSFHHFGHQQRERSIYNQVRSGQMDTLGIGCGGGGQIGGLSYMNAMDVRGYLAAAEEGTGSARPQLMASRRDDRTVALGEAFGLVEGAGIERHRLLALLPDIGPALHKLMELGLVTDDLGWLSLTEAGGFWGYNLAALLAEQMTCTLAATAPVEVEFVTPEIGDRACFSSSTA